MGDHVHMTNGDGAASVLAATGLSGPIVVWRDMLYSGVRHHGIPSGGDLDRRTDFLLRFASEGQSEESIRASLDEPYRAIREAAPGTPFLLWFDACPHDLSVLAHAIVCLDSAGQRNVEIIVVDGFAGIEPFHGLGQLAPEQLASCLDWRLPVTGEHIAFAREVDAAFASQSPAAMASIASKQRAPLPWMAAAAERWLQERPDPVSGLGRLDELALNAILRGATAPGQIYDAVAAADAPPQYWGDSLLWDRINGLAEHVPPLIQIAGPRVRLPIGAGPDVLRAYRIRPAGA